MKKWLKNLNYIYLFFAVFCALLAFFGYSIHQKNNLLNIESSEINEYREAFSNVKIKTNLNGSFEEISLWYENGIYYVFLPSCANLDTTYMTNDCYLSIDGKEIFSSDNLSEIQLNRYYDFTERSDYFEYTNQIIFLKSSNIGTIFIDTESGSLDSLCSDKDYQEKGFMSVYDSNGRQEYSDDLEFISGRGNQTWSFEKNHGPSKL